MPASSPAAVQPVSRWAIMLTSLAFFVPLLAYFLIVRHDWVLLAQVTVLLGLAGLFIRNQEQGLLALLIVRPIADLFGYATVLEFRSLSLNLAAVMSLMVIVWGAWVLLQRRSEFWKRPLFWPIVLWLAVAGYGLTYTASIEATTTELLRLGSLFLLYLVAGELLATRASFQRLTVAFGASLVIPLAFALIQFFTGTGLSFGDVSNRVYGTFGHPNVLAFYLVFVIAFFFTHFFRTKERERAILSLFGFGLMFGVLLMTYTRGAWLGLGIFLVLMGLLRFRKALLITLVSATLLLGISPSINNITTSYFGFDLGRLPVIRRVLDQQSDDSSLEWRFTLWREMGRKFVERPVLGHGLGMFPILREQQVFEFFQGTEAHNDYLRLAVETGMVGLGSYLILQLGVLVQLILKHQQMRNNPDRIFLLGFIAFWCALLCMSFFDNLLQATPFMWAAWVGLAAVLHLKPEPTDR